MCSTFTDRKIEQINSSDLNPTMLAGKTFENILHQIQTSNLNFNLQLSPFSALISLKKTLVKDRTGTSLLPPPCPPARIEAEDMLALAAKNALLERDVAALTINYGNAVDDCEVAHTKIKSLETIIQLKKEPSDAFIHQLEKENDNLKDVIEKQSENISNIEVSNKVQKDINNTLHREIQESKTQFKKMLVVISKEHRVEIKPLRKDLGEVTKENIKLKEILEKTEEHHFSTDSKHVTSARTFIKSSSLINSKPSSMTSSMLGLTPLRSVPPAPGQIHCSWVKSSSSPPSIISSSTISSNRPAAACCSPRTPPGTPPTCKESTSPPTALATNPQSQHLKQPESDVKETNDEEILDISEDEIDYAEDMIDRELLEELDAISRKAYDEDTYSDVDPDSYPEYYWQMEYEDA